MPIMPICTINVIRYVSTEKDNSWFKNRLLYHLWERSRMAVLQMKNRFPFIPGRIPSYQAVQIRLIVFHIQNHFNVDVEAKENQNLPLYIT